MNEDNYKHLVWGILVIAFFAYFWLMTGCAAAGPDLPPIADYRAMYGFSL